VNMQILDTHFIVNGTVNLNYPKPMLSDSVLRSSQAYVPGPTDGQAGLNDGACFRKVQSDKPAS
jgi:hypothetical protein